MFSYKANLASYIISGIKWFLIKKPNVLVIFVAFAVSIYRMTVEKKVLMYSFQFFGQNSTLNLSCYSRL